MLTQCQWDTNTARAQVPVASLTIGIMWEGLGVPKPALSAWIMLHLELSVSIETLTMATSASFGVACKYPLWVGYVIVVLRWRARAVRLSVP